MKTSHLALAAAGALNEVASDTGRLSHSWTVWTDTEITLAPIDMQSLSGTTFYFKVRDANAVEGDWFGPVTVTAGDIDVAATGSLSLTGVAVLTATGSLIVAGTISITGTALLDATGSLAAAGSLAVTGTADLDATGSLAAAAGTLSITGSADLDAGGSLAAAGSLSITGSADLDTSGSLAAAGTLSIGGASDYRAGWINEVASDTGRLAHSWTVWTDTEITLAPIDMQPLSGTTF